MVGVNVFAADTDEEARRLFTSLQQAFLEPGPGPPAPALPAGRQHGRPLDAAERAHVERMTRVSVVGSPESVRRGLEALIAATEADELMLTGQIFDHEARLRSFEIAADVHVGAKPSPR